jgi:glycosyltransferase involved in cell wall biosynthesis
VSEELKRLFAGKVEIKENKISVIPNGFDLSDFQHIEKTIDKNFFYISYVGTISEEYNSKALIEGLKNLAKEVLEKIRIRFVGKVNLKTVNDFEKAGLGKNVELLDYVPHQKAIEFMISSGMLLLIIPEVKNNEGILTGKLFEYLACGRPILFIGPENGNAAKIINDTGSGIVCGYSDDKRITTAITEELRKFPEEGKGIFNDKIMKYSRENLTKELVSIINSH